MFRERLTFEERRRECLRALERRPDHVPTILVRAGKATPLLDKEKFLIPLEVTASQLLFVVRRRLRMKPSEALFLFCNQRMLTGSTPVRLAYADYRDPDGFLYVTYSVENTFGCCVHWLLPVRPMHESDTSSGRRPCSA
jgi:GABA(A) receptor-associated protein